MQYIVEESYKNSYWGGLCNDPTWFLQIKFLIKNPQHLIISFINHLQYIPRIMHAIRALLCFDVFC